MWVDTYIEEVEMDFLPTYAFIHAGRPASEALGDLALCRNECWEVEEFFPETVFKLPETHTHIELQTLARNEPSCDPNRVKVCAPSWRGEADPENQTDDYADRVAYTPLLR